jgi:predicted thioesterase
MEKVGEGTHERFIVDREARGPRLQQKVDAWKARQDR